MKRRKLWEIPALYHCSLIGTCIAPARLRRLAGKADLLANGPLTDYELHVCFVRAADQDGPLSRMLQADLDRAYRSALSRTLHLTRPEALVDYWRQTITTGDIAAGYFALLSHPAATSALMSRLHGDVHMLSHLAGAARRGEARETAEWRTRCEELEGRCAKLRAAADRRGAEADRDRERLLLDLHLLRVRLAQQAETAARHAELEAAGGIEALCRQAAAVQADNAVLHGQLADARAALAEATQAQAAHSERQRSLEDECSRLRGELQRLETMTGARCVRETESVGGPAAAPLPDLRGRCILYLGGRDRLTAHFRMLVERLSGEFLHHDGGLADRPARLPGLVSQADAVLCPVDCVSHDAGLRVKQCCQRNRKPLIWLRNASLASFVHGLHDLVHAA